ncbi:MAG: hypothetical protein GX096_15310 [Clostridiales bacterium]|nr:hypothetical protein [Clostridiales bacterium]
MTKECVLKAIKRTDREVELAMETVRLYLKQELADCVYQREIGMNTDRGYERGIKVAYEVISDFQWDEER